MKDESRAALDAVNADVHWTARWTQPENLPPPSETRGAHGSTFLVNREDGGTEVLGDDAVTTLRLVVLQLVAATLGIGAAPVLLAQGSAPVPPLVRFVEATQSDERVSATALREIAATWKDSYTPMFTDIARFMRAPARGTLDAPPDAGSSAVDRDDPTDGTRPSAAVEQADVR